jgi:hypothetical protein
MTKLQNLILEINTLNPNELELIFREVLHRINLTRRAEKALDELIGSGKGTWESDAQDYVDALRENDRT